ncbi:MAG: hypothetical protein ABSF60_06395 [Verrucomicrobiota bacterium]
MPVEGGVDWGMAFAAAGVLVLTGCAGVSSGDCAQKGTPRFSHPRAITHLYLPLASLKRDVLENKSDRVERTAKPELHKTFEVGGQTVEALVVEDRDYENGKLTEVTLDFFAQDDAGAVYYLGEDVDEYKDGRVVGHGVRGCGAKTPRIRASSCQLLRGPATSSGPRTCCISPRKRTGWFPFPKP